MCIKDREREEIHVGGGSVTVMSALDMVKAEALCLPGPTGMNAMS